MGTIGVPARPCSKVKDLTENIGQADRAIRIGVGLLLLGSPLAWYGLESISSWGYLGLAPLLTGLFGSCPIYRALGLRTTRK